MIKIDVQPEEARGIFLLLIFGLDLSRRYPPWRLMFLKDKAMD